MAEDNRRRSTVNVARLTMWKMTGDTSAATTYEETPYTWENSLAAVKYTPKMQTNEQYGGSVTLHPKRFAVLDCEIAKISLTSYAGVPLFALTFARATRSEKGAASRCFGETDKNGTEVSGSDDIVPSVATAYYTKRPDGKINLYKFPKTKFMPEGEDSKQQEGTNFYPCTAKR